MKIKRTIQIEVEMTSEASEAALITCIDSFIDEMKSHSENMRLDRWYTSIPVSWDESKPVEIKVAITDK
jgi:hypothetical protein